jgi:hypothetical protein
MDAAKVMSEKIIHLDAARIEFWRNKFFPHLLPHYGALCIIAILATHQKPDQK